MNDKGVQMKKEDAIKKNSYKINWTVTMIPVALVLAISLVLTLLPNTFEHALAFLQDIFVNKTGFSYIIFNLFCLGAALCVALSKYGKIKLGDLEKPRYNTFSWVAMIFTSTMAADMLYWAMIEWIYYYQSAPFGVDPAVRTAAETQKIVSAYPLFHWGPMSWIYFILPGAIVGFMMFVKKCPKETIAEACRPVLGKRVDGWLGIVIDILCVTCCLISCPVLLRIGTPVIVSLMSSLLGTPDNALMQVATILIIAVLYTIATIVGMRAMRLLSDIGMYLYIAVCLIFFILGPTLYILESTVSSIGFVAENYISMSTWLDPLRLTAGADGMGFPQQWTVFFNANWIVCISAVPFFIAKISEGRTIRNTIIGGLLGGAGATWFSFIIFGNYSIFQQMNGIADYSKMVEDGYTEAQIIVEIVKSLPIAQIMLFMLIVCMIVLFATTFDANCLMISGFCQREREVGQEPSKGIRFFFAAMIALIPIAMSIANTPLSQLKTIMILAAYPMMILLLIMVIGFFKDLKRVDMEHYDPEKGIDPEIFRS